MDWSDADVQQAWAAWRGDPDNPAKDANPIDAAMRRVMTSAVELAAARGGTMTADELGIADAYIPGLNSSLREMTSRMMAHISAIGARNAVLEAEVKRLSQSAAVTETMALRREVSELKARCATLSAAGQVLSDKDLECDHSHGGVNVRSDGVEVCIDCDEPIRWPCSPTCTHDDANKPGHPERMRERSEAVNAVTGAPDPVGALAVRAGAKPGREIASYRAGYEQGCDDMRAACLEAVRLVLQRHGFTGEYVVAEFKAAIEGAAP